MYRVSQLELSEENKCFFRESIKALPEFLKIVDWVLDLPDEIMIL